MKTITEPRPSPIAGQWYPGDAYRLAEQVDQFIAAARLPALEGEVVAVMAPHAGHRYSGAVAGYAFAALRGLQPELVAVISPMHYPYSHPLLTTAHPAYVTPLGRLDVDLEALESLDKLLRQGTSERAGLDIGLARVTNDPEHSLEIELPFLQRVLPASFRLLPVMVRDQGQATAHALGLALAHVLSGRPALLVASTDLSHFYSQEVAKKLDGEIMSQVAAFDPQGLLLAEYQGRGFACGHGALAAVMWASKALGADRAVVLRHATSGDVTGDYDRVVGYGAAAFLRSPEPPAAT